MWLFALLAEEGDLTIKGAGAESFTINNPLRAEITDISGLMSVLISFLFPLAAVLLFCMLSYAGFVYLSSEGNAEKVNKARTIITSSIIGLIILFLAFFIIRIVSAIFGFQGGILPS